MGVFNKTIIPPALVGYEMIIANEAHSVELAKGTFKIQRRGRQRERQKTIGLISKTTTSHVHHTILYISFPFLHDYDVKMPNFAFYGGRKQATTKFYFSF